jgi:hypothetical protein
MSVVAKTAGAAGLPLPELFGIGLEQAGSDARRAGAVRPAAPPR